MYHGDGVVALSSCVSSLRFLEDGESTLHDAGRDSSVSSGSAADDEDWGASISIVWGMVPTGGLSTACCRLLD